MSWPWLPWLQRDNTSKWIYSNHQPNQKNKTQAKNPASILLHLTPFNQSLTLSKTPGFLFWYKFNTNFVKTHRHRNRASTVSWSSMTSVGDEGRSPCNGGKTGAWPERSFAFPRWLIWVVWKSRMGWTLKGLVGWCWRVYSLFVPASWVSWNPFSDKLHVDMVQDCTSPSTDKSQNQGYYL